MLKEVKEVTAARRQARRPPSSSPSTHRNKVGEIKPKKKDRRGKGAKARQYAKFQERLQQKWWMRAKKLEVDSHLMPASSQDDVVEDAYNKSKDEKPDGYETLRPSCQSTASDAHPDEIENVQVPVVVLIKEEPSDEEPDGDRGRCRDDDESDC